MRVGEKAQGLPIHVIIVLVLGIIILAVVLLYVFGVIGEGSKASIDIFNIGGNVSKNATEEVTGFFG